MTSFRVADEGKSLLRNCPHGSRTLTLQVADTAVSGLVVVVLDGPTWTVGVVTLEETGVGVVGEVGAAFPVFSWMALTTNTVESHHLNLKQ